MQKMEFGEIERIKQLLQPLFARTGVIKAVLFGSLATGKESKRSDLDLMIVKDTDRRFFDRYEEFSSVNVLVRDRAVEMLIYTPLELERISHRPFIKRILKEGIVLYEH
jgi:predicted nucleotidyltransferase